MATSTYQELLTEVQGWMDRYDDDFVNRLPSFITWTEQQCNRVLRVPQMEAAIRGDVDVNGQFDVPEDYIEARYMAYIEGEWEEDNALWYFNPNLVKPLNRAQTGIALINAVTEYETLPNYFTRIPAHLFSFTPFLEYSLEGEEFRLDQNSGKTLSSVSPKYELAYYSEVPELTELENTNWLIRKAPEIYFFGCMFHASAYTRDDREGYWKDRFEAAVVNLQKESDKQEESGGRIVIPAGMWGK